MVIINHKLYTTYFIMTLSEAQKQLITLSSIIILLFIFMWWNSSSAYYAYYDWESNCKSVEMKQCIFCDNTISIQACIDNTKTFSSCYSSNSNVNKCQYLFYKMITEHNDATIFSYMLWICVIGLIIKMCDIFQNEWHRIRQNNNNLNGSIYQPLATQETNTEPRADYVAMQGEQIEFVSNNTRQNHP